MRITKRKSAQETIRKTANVLKATQARAAQLQAENDYLHYQHQLLAAMCKGFDWFRHLQLHALLGDTQLMQLDSEQLTPENLQQQLANCFATEDEALLLQQLSAQPLLDAVADLTSALHGSHPLQERINSSSSTNINTSSLTPADLSSSSYSQPLAPPEDPLWLLKHVLTQPPPPCCANLEAMTLQELQAHYKATVHDLSLWLVQYTAGGIAGPTELEAKIQAALTEHLQLIGQLCTVRSELVTALQLSNSDTGEQISEPDTQRIAWVVERLQLTQQQLHSIARGMSVFKRLLTPVLEELRQLQQQVDECSSPCASNSNSAGTSDGVGVCHAEATGPAQQQQQQQYTSSSARRRVLEQQEQRSARMKMLLRKDHFLRTWFSSYLYGQLSWVQLARMHVLMVPFYPVPFVFFSEVAAKVALNQAKHEQECSQDAQEGAPDSTSM